MDEENFGWSKIVALIKTALSTNPTAPAAPAPSFAFPLNVHDHVHALAFQELHGALTHVF
jgi:hypothetical protein